jgi:hypothetical protein
MLTYSGWYDMRACGRTPDAKTCPIETVTKANMRSRLNKDTAIEKKIVCLNKCLDKIQQLRANAEF